MYVWIRQLHWYVLFSFHSSKHTQKEPILNVSLRERAHPTTTSPDRPNITSAHIRMDVKRLVMDDYGLVQQPRSKIQTHSNCVTSLLEFKDAASQCDCIATVESQTLEHSFVHTSSLQLVTCTTILLLSSPLPNKKKGTTSLPSSYSSSVSSPRYLQRLLRTRSSQEDVLVHCLLIFIYLSIISSISKLLSPLTF
jgi:hypothetical protein